MGFSESFAFGCGEVEGEAFFGGRVVCSVVFRELEGGEAEPRDPGDVGAEDFPEEEDGDDAGEHGMGEVEVV